MQLKIDFKKNRRSLKTILQRFFYDTEFLPLPESGLDCVFFSNLPQRRIFKLTDKEYSVRIGTGDLRHTAILVIFDIHIYNEIGRDRSGNSRHITSTPGSGASVSFAAGSSATV